MGTTDICVAEAHSDPSKCDTLKSGCAGGAGMFAETGNSPLPRRCPFVVSLGHIGGASTSTAHRPLSFSHHRKIFLPFLFPQRFYSIPAFPLPLPKTFCIIASLGLGF